MKNMIFLLLVLLGINTGYADIVMETDGFGFTSRQAIGDALRKALEHCTGEEIFSHPVIKKFAVLQDVIITRQFGLITDYSVLSEEQKTENHLWRVRVKVQISTRADYRWKQLREILEKRGLPSIMFCIRERLDAKSLRQPIGEYQLHQKFEDMGFKVLKCPLAKNGKSHEKIFSDESCRNINEACRKAGADYMVIGMLNGKYIAPLGVSPDIRHDYDFTLQIIRIDPLNITGAFRWPFTYQADNLEFSRESAGKAGFAEIIEPEYVQIIVMEIIKDWIADSGILSNNTGDKQQ